MSLTPKQHLKALHEVGRHVGMWGPLRVIAERQGWVPDIKNPVVPLEDALYMALDTDVTAYRRHACARILDYYFPSWREVVPAELLGPLVTRDSPEVAEWRSGVLVRDEHQCQHCGSKEDLHAHHEMGWADAPELRTIIDNGITLCSSCHAQAHPELAASFVGGVA